MSFAEKLDDIKKDVQSTDEDPKKKGYIGIGAGIGFAAGIIFAFTRRKGLLGYAAYGFGGFVLGGFAGRITNAFSSGA